MSRQLPRFQSKKNSLEVERENFEKSQQTCIAKAINTTETAVKEKHIRSAIIGTYQERGAKTFWDCVFRLPLVDSCVACWKFCFVLHKILREGHDNVLKDSLEFKGMLKEHQSLWGHMKSGYGPLIKDYCQLLLTKLSFHKRFPRIPGKLEMKYQDLANSMDNQDAFFELSIAMLDYLDDIVQLRNSIFKTIDSSKCNSMTLSGQCRLTPLIPCIQDSMILYDFTTKIMFYLHSRLSPDLLDGHRERFLKIFHELTDLYAKTMSMQYFRNLIDIQQLPKNPPNFLMQSDLDNYQTRTVTVLNGHSSDAQNDIHSDTVSDIVDLNDTNTNGSNSPDPSAIALQNERESRIRELEEEVQRLRDELSRLKQEARHRFQLLQMEIKELNSQLEEKNALISEKEKRIAELEKHVCKAPEDVLQKIDLAEKNSAALEERFSKVKSMYSKLSAEHVELLRQKGACDKELVKFKKDIEGYGELSTVVENIRKEKEEVETNLFAKLTKKDAHCEELEESVAKLTSKIREAENTKQSLEKELKAELDKFRNETQLFKEGQASSNEMNKIMVGQIEDLTKKLAELTKELLSTNSEKEKFQAHITELQAQLGDNQKSLESEALQRYNDLLNVCVEQSEGIIRKTVEDLENPLLTGSTGALDHFIISCRGTDQIVQMLDDATKKGFTTFPALRDIVEGLPIFTHHMSSLMLHGGASSKTSADIQKGDEMLGQCRDLGSAILSVFGAVRQRSTNDKVEAFYNDVRASLKKLLETACNLGSSLTPEADAADVLDKELHAMELAIEEASKRMEEILRDSRASHTGVKLEVNEKLLDSCTTLMNAIRLLVQRSKSLQKEIVAQGKGSASVKEFYKRNHQWTEGLISAAKAVGGGAKFLLESADKAVSNPAAGFEFLIASSQDIAASTIQLVVASQVRAERSSQNLTLLKQASTAVKTATAGVVATAKDCSQLFEESDEVDLTKLTTHNAKRLELETQAEVLRLQTDLEKARMKLAALRQHHYHNSD